MAEKYHLDYKTQYLPDENIEHLRKLRGDEEEKNYHLVVGYTDLGAFLTPLSIMSIQENARKFRKEICDNIFTPCKVLNGLDSDSNQHINLQLRTFADIGSANNLEIITSQ